MERLIALHHSFLDWRFSKLISKCLMKRKAITFRIVVGFGNRIHVYTCIGDINVYAIRKKVFDFSMSLNKKVKWTKGLSCMWHVIVCGCGINTT